MIYLSSIKVSSDKNTDVFPFNLPLFQQFDGFEFTSPITFFIGENGTGKSTILEGIAANAKLPAIGGEDISRDPTMENARTLADEMKASWKVKTHKGFFLRAEDVFGFTNKINQSNQELKKLADKYDKEFTGYARQLATGAALGQKEGLTKRYGENLDANSHGETFLKILQNRFVPGGLYLLDEPETPLSFNRQLSLLVLINEMVKQGCQFIIATHSPVLTAFPNAKIISFDEYPPKEIAYKDIEQFSLMKDFLNNPAPFLHHLVKD